MTPISLVVLSEELDSDGLITVSIALDSSRVAYLQALIESYEGLATLRTESGPINSPAEFDKFDYRNSNFSDSTILALRCNKDSIVELKGLLSTL